jgi:hypothetical protein
MPYRYVYTVPLDDEQISRDCKDKENKVNIDEKGRDNGDKKNSREYPIANYMIRPV